MRVVLNVHADGLICFEWELNKSMYLQKQNMLWHFCDTYKIYRC
jgi:hypothetical protein